MKAEHRYGRQCRRSWDYVGSLGVQRLNIGMGEISKALPDPHTAYSKE